MGPRIIIVGAGLSGLSAAGKLEELGYRPLLVESNAEIGGRIQTEQKEGYLFDAGFQVLLDSYPELPLQCKQDLGLKKYIKGARYKTEDGWQDLEFSSLLSWDMDTKKSIYILGKALLKKTPKMSTDCYLRELALPPVWVEQFLAPFLRGVFLESELEMAASRFLDLLPYFATGNACLPKSGMQALPRWFASRLKKSEIRLKSPVIEAAPKQVVLSSGEKLEADGVILALSLPALSKLIPSIPPWKSASCYCDYFMVDSDAIVSKPILYLDGRKESPINNFSILSAVQPSYAPLGKHLISTTTVGPKKSPLEEIIDYLRQELKIPNIVHLKRDWIEHALPIQTDGPLFSSRNVNGIFLAGESVDIPSINGAIASGKKTAKELHEFLESVNQ